MEMQRTQIAKTTLKKNKAGDSHLTNFKTKTRHWPIHKQKGENPETEPIADAKPVSTQ